MEEIYYKLKENIGDIEIILYVKYSNYLSHIL